MSGLPHGIWQRSADRVDAAAHARPNSHEHLGGGVVGRAKDPLVLASLVAVDRWRWGEACLAQV